MKQEKDVKQEGSEIHGQKTDGKKEKPNDIEQSSSWQDGYCLKGHELFITGSLIIT